jgi:hypothetical protein
MVETVSVPWVNDGPLPTLPMLVAHRVNCFVIDGTVAEAPVGADDGGDAVT